MPRASQNGENRDARAERIREVIMDCLQRRNLGEEVSDASVIEQHADLMPELGEDLQLLGALDEPSAPMEDEPRYDSSHNDDSELAQGSALRTPQPKSPTPGANRSQPDAAGRGLSLHCPHCRHAIRVSADTPFTDITCSACGNHFSLIDETEDAMDARRGKHIAHFELIRRVGAGSFGAVWKARDTKLDRTVAVKVPRQWILARTELEQFLREARAAAQLSHPNIVSVHEVGRDGDAVYIVCDFVSGVPLSDWLRQHPPTFREVAELGVRIAGALHHAHEAGIIHRDLKPQNIMVDSDGQPHLMDFGLARREAGETTMTTDGQVLGTPAYMSPEQARGQSHLADRRTDVYSLGVILFELLTGELPFRGTARMMMQQVLYEDPSGPRRLNGAVPKDLDTIVLKAMAKEPHRRYDTASQFAEDLQRFLDGKPILARRTGRLDHLWRWAKRQPAIAALAAIVTTLLLFLAIAGPLVAWKQGLLAEQQRCLLYVSEVNTAYQAWEEANLDRARALLSRHRHETDLRSFPWDLLWTQLEAVSRTPTLGHTDARCAAFSPDGNVLATGGREPSIKLWDLRLPQRKLIAPLPGHSEAVTALAFSPDGDLLAASSNDGTVTLWDVTTHRQIERLEGHTAAVDSVAISPDGQTLASASADDTVKLWDLATRTERTTLTGHRSNVNVVVFSPDGQTLASGSDDETVALWDVETGRRFRVFEHRHGVCAAAFSPDGKRFACGGLGNDIKLWDMPSGKLLEIISVPAHHKVDSLAFSHDSRTLASGGRDRTVRLWDTSTERPLTTRLLTTIRGHTQDVTSVTFSPDDRTLATASLDGVVKLWDVRRHTADRLPQPRGGWAVPLAFSPDSKTLAVGTGIYFLESEAESGSLRLFDVSTGTKRFEVIQKTSIRTLAFCPPDGEILATGGGDVVRETGEIKLWDPSNGKRFLELERRIDLNWSSGTVLSVAFSTDGRYFAAGGGYESGQGELVVWDFVTGKRLPPLEGETGRPVSIAFSPNPVSAPMILAAGTFKPNNQIILWDLARGQRLHTIDGRTAIISIAFSPDGKTLASSGKDDMVRLWDVATGTLLHVLSGHSLQVLAVAYSPDGKTIASGSTDNTVKLWQASTGDELATLKSPCTITWLAFSADGTMLAAGGVDKRVILWHADIEKSGWPVSLR